MLHKTFDAIEIKADGDTGEFTATVAAFGNVDHVGDRILPGAFSKTLERWRQTGDPIPVILSHQHENPMSHIGVAYPQDVQETAKGLLVKATLDIADNEVARQVHKLMKRRSLKEFSFGYKVPKGGEKRAKDGANDLSEIDLFEVGPTLKGANPATELHGVKSALAKQADDDAAEPQDDQPPTSQQAQILNAMIAQAQEYIASKPDDEDVSEMQDIIETLQDLLEEPGSDDDSEDAAKSERKLRKQSERLLREEQAKQLSRGDPIQVEARLRQAQEALIAMEAFDPSEVAGMNAGLLKAVWTAAAINDLPDGAFLYVESGGSKDSDGKTTPRSLRHFPYKGADGAVDLPHLRNALARIPQSNLPQSVKGTLTAKAQRILADNTKSAVEDARDEDRPAGKSHAQDLLRRRSDAAMLEVQSGGLSLRRPPKPQEQAKAEPLDEAELRRRSREAMLAILTGADPNDEERARAQGR